MQRSSKTTAASGSIIYYADGVAKTLNERLLPQIVIRKRNLFDNTGLRGYCYIHGGVTGGERNLDMRPAPAWRRDMRFRNPAN